MYLSFVFILLWIAVHGLNTFFPLKCLCSLFTGRTLTSLLCMLEIFPPGFGLPLNFKIPFFKYGYLNLYNANLAIFFSSQFLPLELELERASLVLHYVNGAFIASFKNLKF